MVFKVFDENGSVKIDFVEVYARHEVAALKIHKRIEKVGSINCWRRDSNFVSRCQNQGGPE